MKKLYTLITAFFMCSISSIAQVGYINTIAGNGVQGYAGDGGLAINAMINQPNDVSFDSHGNLYIVDFNNGRIRKISAATGIITTVAGNGISSGLVSGVLATNAFLAAPEQIAFDASDNMYIVDFSFACVRMVSSTTGIITTVAGTGVSGYSGDGGLATNAMLNNPTSIILDGYGNLYISDYYNNRIRKVSANTGIITTVVGTGTAGYSGNGNVATNAQIHGPWGLAIDLSGNLYFSDAINRCVRKVTATTGIITTVAGTTIADTTGDGGLAINACMLTPSDIDVDNDGNIYIADQSNPRIRKVSASTGIISTIAGNGVSSYSGDGGPAINGSFDHINGINVDVAGNLYIADFYNYRIRKVNGNGSLVASTDSFNVYVNSICSGPEFNIVPVHYSSLYNIKTYFGDGSFSIDTFSSFNGYAAFEHLYSYPGNYSIKHVFYNGTIAIDSTTYNYNYSFCRTLSVKLYNDNNSNCIYDSSIESLASYPTTIEIDSNGIAIDTISASSGYNYNANGNLGDVYQFKVLTTISGASVTCPATGIISDTLAIGNNATKYIGFHCTGTSGFDLTEQVSMYTGRHIQLGHLIVNNLDCSPHNGTVTVNFSSKYVYQSSVPTPTSINGTTITWDLNNLSAIYSGPVYIDYTLIVPGVWLTTGDTVHSEESITPIIGDINPVNNTCIRVDTVKSSFDPNEMEVSPEGNILAGTQLTYTIGFENTGNDTAQNIYILDTLSNYLDIHSLAMVACSNTTIISKTWNGMNWVLKLDFPNIKLLDSSHHNQCNGMVVFTMRTKAGLADGTVIPNSASIYFDDNPAVLTDTVYNIIGTPTSVANTTSSSTINIYPNPTNSILHIDNLKGSTDYRIINVIGQAVVQGVLQVGANTISTKELGAGVYVLELTSDKGERTVTRLVKE